MFLRLKIYAALIGAALATFIAVYFRGRSDKQNEMEYEFQDERLNKILKAKGAHDDVQKLNDNDVASAARKWVRSNSQ